MVPFEDRITFPDLAALLGLSRTQLLREIERNGLPCEQRPKTRGGEYLFSKSAVMRWAFDQARRPAGGAVLDLNAERARLAKEQADHTAMRNARMRGKLVSVADVEQAVTAAFSRVRGHMRAIPDKLGPRGERRPAAELAVIAARLIDQSLTELSEIEIVEATCGGDESLRVAFPAACGAACSRSEPGVSIANGG